MSTCVLINSNAGSAANGGPLQDALRSDPNFVIREMKSGEDWQALLAEVAAGGFERIIAAGGDGTVHAVINALLKAGSRTTLGIIPLGTGNDLCRTLAIPFDPCEALDLLKNPRDRSLDAVRVTGDRAGYFANAATGGFSGQVAVEVTSETKASWGPLAYLRGAVAPLADLPKFPVRIRFDDGPPEDMDVLNIVIANGRTAAGGIPVAPAANPEDGLLDVVIVRSNESLDIPLLASRLMQGSYVDDENVIFRHAKRVEIESDNPMPFSIDGEKCEGRRFAFEIVPQALQIAVGPDYAAEIVQESPVEMEDSSEVRTDPQPHRNRLFGLLTGLLLVVKRIRTGPLIFLGTAAILLLIAWFAQGTLAGDWTDWNERAQSFSRSHSSDALDRVAMAVTWLGGVGGTVLASTLVLVYLARTRHYLTAGTFLAVLLGVLLLELTLKPLFAIARPVPFSDLVADRGYAFPSGHALRGVGIYGLLAALAIGHSRGRIIWWFVAAICAAIAIGICWSRVYLGVHWLTDVIMGGMLAAAWVATCSIARSHVQRKRPT